MKPSTRSQAGEPGAVLGVAARGSASRPGTTGRSSSPARAGSCPCSSRSSRAAASPRAVREQGPLEGAAALVHVLAGAPDRATTSGCSSEAARARLPIVAVVPSPRTSRRTSRTCSTRTSSASAAAAGFPVDEIARRLARVLGEAATSLAARLPVLRAAGLRRADPAGSRGRTASSASPSSCPGADLPVLTAEPDPARAADRRRLRVRDRPRAPAGGARRDRRRPSASARSPGSRSGSSRSSAGR